VDRDEVFIWGRFQKYSGTMQYIVKFSQSINLKDFKDRWDFLFGEGSQNIREQTKI
jgi:hypothetical protein